MPNTAAGYQLPTKDLAGALSPNYASSFNLGLSPSGTSSPATTAAIGADTGAGGALDTIAPYLAGGVAAYQGYQGLKDVKGTTSALGQTQQALGKAGQQYLGQALSGQLTPAQQATADTLRQQGATLAGQAQPYLQAGAQGLLAYQQGQLPAWQQQQLDNQTAAAIAQARASMGANVDSSSMAQVEASIRNQAEITKGQMLQSNLKISQDLAQMGFTNELQSMKLYDAANESVTKALQQDFTNALEALGITDQAALARLQASIQGNSAVGGAVGSLLGNLAKATTLGAAQGSGGSLSTALSKLFGGGSTTSAADWASQGQSYLDVANQQIASDLGQQFTSDFASMAAAPDYSYVDLPTI